MGCQYLAWYGVVPLVSPVRVVGVLWRAGLGKAVLPASYYKDW